MKTARIALVAVLSAAAFAAHADDSWQFRSGIPFEGKLTREQVQAELEQSRNAPNTYSIKYNPVANFKSQLTPEQVRAEFLASREAVAAMTGEDSGSAYLAAHKAKVDSGTRLAGSPVNAQ